MEDQPLTCFKVIFPCGYKFSVWNISIKEYEMPLCPLHHKECPNKELIIYDLRDKTTLLNDVSKDYFSNKAVDMINKSLKIKKKIPKNKK